MINKIKKIVAVFVAAVVAATALAVSASANSKYYIKPIFSNVNIRTGPGAQYETIGEAKVGGKYTCLGTAFASDGTMWYKIAISNYESAGWISSDYSRRYERNQNGGVKPTTVDKSGSKVNEQIQTYINSAADKYNAVGIQVAVIRAADKKIFTWNYGYSSRNTVPMTSNTKIRTASISKVAVAMCALKMQENGLVECDADIGEYWGAELPKKVTLYDLFSHTSTLGYLGFKGSINGTRNQLIDRKSYMGGEPGEASSWMYNNYGIGIAGSTLELAANKTVDEYMRENIFSRIGVDASFFSGRFSEDADIATLYEFDGSVERTVAEARGIMGTNKPGRSMSIHAGSLTASAKDIAKLFYVLSNDGKYGSRRILSEESVNTMEKKLFKASEDDKEFTQCMALRYMDNCCGTDELYYHAGNAYGAVTMASYNPETGDVVVVLTTGASQKRDKYGIYEICGKLSSVMYLNMENLGK